MATITERAPLTAMTASRRLEGQAILVAMDHGAGANAAARVAAAIAAKHGAQPHVVRAFDTGGVGLPGPVASMMAAADAVLGPEVHEPERNALRGELRSLFGREMHWPVHIHPGTPAGVIVREAAETDAALIVLGLRRHGLFDRVVHDETTLNVMRGATCPVLGVAPSLTVLPRCAVVGMDFSVSAMEAARLALDVLDPHGTLVLAYVTGLADAGAERGGSGAIQAEEELDRIIQDLGVPAGVTVSRVRFDAAALPSTAAALLSVASEYQADVVAVGSRREPWIERVMHESVSTDLARDGRHSVLVVPPPRIG